MDTDTVMEDSVDSEGALFRFTANFQQKEFVGQKPMSVDIEETIWGETCCQILDVIWAKVQPWLKREILVNGDSFSFSENESPARADIANFIVFQDKNARKNYTVSQLNTDVLRKWRDKHVNVMVHIYGKAIASKTIHQKVTASILQPTVRDRAGAHSTTTLVELAQKLKDHHGSYLSGNMSSWCMWANSIHASPIHQQEALVKELPPSHLVHLFRSVPTAENEIMSSVKNGLQVANNLNDMYAENIKIIRQEFTKFKENTLRAFDMFDLRLSATEEMLSSHSRLVGSMNGALTVEINAVSVQEEQQIPDLEDCDH